MRAVELAPVVAPSPDARSTAALVAHQIVRAVVVGHDKEHLAVSYTHLP